MVIIISLFIMVYTLWWIVDFEPNIIKNGKNLAIKFIFYTLQFLIEIYLLSWICRCVFRLIEKVIK